MEKHNIEIKEREGISAYLKGDENLEIALKKDIEEKIRKTLAEEPEEVEGAGPEYKIQDFSST